MCSVGASAPTNSQPQYVHNPYLDGGAYGNSVDANRIGTSALTIGLDPQAAKGSAAVGTGLVVSPSNPGASPLKPTPVNSSTQTPAGQSPPTSNTQPVRANPLAIQ